MTVCTWEHLHTHARVRDCVSATVAHVSLCACSVRVLSDVTASNTRDSFTDGDGESCALHSTHGTLHAAHGTLHAARTLHRMACTRKTRSEHAAHMHAYVTVCTLEGGSGSTYICVHAYMTVCTWELCTRHTAR
jgi:hypothetical protein